MTAPVILWLRRDLRLTDHPMLSEAAACGRPLIPLFILDPETEAIGAAAKWRLGLALEAFSTALNGIGSRLTLRRGPAGTVIQGLMRETGAGAVWWTRAYDPASIARDGGLKASLKAQGREARSFPGFLLHEPMTVQTGEGGPYKVFTPFWRAVRQMPVGDSLPTVARLPGPREWPVSARLDDWALGAAMGRGAAVCLPHQSPGEKAALSRLQRFLDGPVFGYGLERDFPALPSTSGLSEHLTYGEISPRLIWHAGWRAMEEGAAGAETFLRQLIWRDFAWSLMFHFPDLARANWRAGWDRFPWAGDSADADRWRQGMTGEPIVDAGLREMVVTGRMHNRVRMIVASYLTKHLLTHWRVGLDWFATCLSDWDPAANAMGWQWVAGSGPDAAPYFRVFNPASQAERFDPEGHYRRRWLAEWSRTPGPEALSYFDAVPKAWGLDPARPYPMPMVALDQGRARALAAYAAGKT